MDFSEKGNTICDLQHISGREFFEMLSNQVLLIDVRPEYEISKKFDVPNIVYCPYSEVENNLSQFNKNKLLVIADAVGLRSKEVAFLLKNLGFKYVCNLVGGIVEWERDGLPIQSDVTKMLTGSCMCQLNARKI